MSDTQDNTAAGQQIENTSSDTLKTQDIAQGNTALAGMSTQGTASSSESSPAALSGSGESGNVDAGASAAGAPANTSSDAPLASPSSSESQQNEQLAQSSSAPAAGSLTSLPSAQLEQAGDSPTSDLAVDPTLEPAPHAPVIETPPAPVPPAADPQPEFVPSPVFAAPNPLSLPPIVNARLQALATPDTDLGDHPAAAHIDAIVSTTQATAVQGTPAEFVEYVEVKARMIRGAIAAGEASVEQHLAELAKMANAIAHVPAELVSFIRQKAVLIAEHAAG